MFCCIYRIYLGYYVDGGICIICGYDGNLRG